MKLGKVLLGHLAHQVGALSRVAHDTVGNQWRNWVLRPATRLAKPSGISYDPKTGKMIYTPRESFEGLEGWKGLREIAGDYLGRAYNNADIFDRGAKYLDRWGASKIDDALDNPLVSRLSSGTAKTLAWAGLGTGLLDTALEMTGNEDSKWHGLGRWNPFQWIQMSEYSPTNLLFNYTTPVGAGLTAIANGVTGLTKNVAQAASSATIEQTAKALSELNTMERLAYLFNPKGVSDKYKKQATKELEKYLKSFDNSSSETTGDFTTDNALRDVDSVTRNTRY